MLISLPAAEHSPRRSIEDEEKRQSTRRKGRVAAFR